MAQYLVYQAYGHTDILHECLYSLYSFAATGSDAQVVIYTDQQVYMEAHLPANISVVFRPVDTARIRAWRGGHDFVHRFKVMMLRDFCSTLNREDEILYVDTDVTFTAPVREIFEDIHTGSLYMHTCEGNIRKPGHKNLVFKKLAAYMSSGAPGAARIPSGQDMWNAGVLGFRAADAALLDEVLAFTDAVYPEYPKHIVEQLAFSVVFSHQKRALRASDQQIFHYWNFKEFRAVLRAFFAQPATPERRAAAIEAINPLRLSQPKAAYEALGFIARNIRKLGGKWKMPAYSLDVGP